MGNILKELYHKLYSPPNLEALEQEIENDHRELIRRLETPERALVLRIIDNSDVIAERISQDSFIRGFQLAWQITSELKNYKNGCLVSDCEVEPSARLNFEEETK